MMRLLTALLAAALPLAAQSATLECTADTFLDRRQPRSNQGTAKELPLYGQERVLLFQFRLSALPPTGTVTRAALWLKHESLDVPKRLHAAAVPISWREKEATWAEAQAGQAWTPRGGNIADIALRRSDKKVPGVRRTTDRERGWLEVELEPSLVEALRQGTSHGLLLSGGRLDGELLFQSRETIQGAAYLVVEWR